LVPKNPLIAITSCRADGEVLPNAEPWEWRSLADRGCARLGWGAQILVSIDCDELDPTALPAMNMPTPGGLTYSDLIELLTGVAAKARIAGLAIMEPVPERDDPNKLSV
jgi:agmatinase